jgi:hypothetical protein
MISLITTVSRCIRFHWCWPIRRLQLFTTLVWCLTFELWIANELNSGFVRCHAFQTTSTFFLLLASYNVMFIIFNGQLILRINAFFIFYRRLFLCITRSIYTVNRKLYFNILTRICIILYSFYTFKRGSFFIFNFSSF